MEKHHAQKLSSSKKTSTVSHSPLSTGILLEETLPYCKLENYYPTKIGDIYEARYQVSRKFGYGAYSTSWLKLSDAYAGTWVAHEDATIPLVSLESFESRLFGQEKDLLSSLWSQCLNGCQRNARQPSSCLRIYGCSSVSARIWPVTKGNIGSKLMIVLPLFLALSGPNV